MTGRSIALVVFALLLLLSSWLIGGAAAWIYLIVYALAMVPGFPLGFTLFGRDHAAGWIAGAILGYALTALAMWVPIAAHVPSALTFVIRASPIQFNAGLRSPPGHRRAPAAA